MARPRKFDEERVVDAAMRVFWATGYQATSTEELCEATGLGRGSIYNAFTSKRDLFKRALQRYMDTMTTRQIALLESHLPVREKLRRLLYQAIDEEEQQRRGCLVVNTIVELAPCDPEIAELLCRDYNRRLEALRAAIDRGRRDGEIAADRDPTALAHFINATLGGMQVAARGGADRGVLEGIVAIALRVI